MKSIFINEVAAFFILLNMFSCSGVKTASMTSQDFEFVSGNKKLSGIIDQRLDHVGKAIIIFVHGSGRTDIRRENRYFDLRSRFTSLGITCVMWDKPGQGKSEGIFDENQLLEESAQEVLDAVKWLAERKVPGYKKIGIWSTSRGGWVAPIVLSQNNNLKFWMSVSGVPAADNKYYLVKSNLPLEGRTPEETEVLMNEWKRGREIFFQGGDYELYLSATETIRKDPAVTYFAGDLTGTKEAFDAEQKAYLQNKEQYPLDENFSILRVLNFADTLRKLDLDVLALFGERDTNVDWRTAKALYESTVGQNSKATLTTHTFPNCNHSMSVSPTGSVREVEGTPLDAGTKCKGYYDVQIEWIKKYVVSE